MHAHTTDVPAHQFKVVWMKDGTLIGGIWQDMGNCYNADEAWIITTVGTLEDVLKVINSGLDSKDMVEHVLCQVCIPYTSFNMVFIGSCITVQCLEEFINKSQ